MTDIAKDYLSALFNGDFKEIPTKGDCDTFYDTFDMAVKKVKDDAKEKGTDEDLVYIERFENAVAKGKEDAMRESFFAGMQQGVKLLLMLIDMPIG